MKRTPSIASPKDCKAASEGKTGATATGANVVCGAVPSWQVASVSASPAVSRTRNVQFIESPCVSGTRGSELTSSRMAGQGGIFCRHAHSHRTPHTRLYRIGDPRDDPARQRARGHQPLAGLPNFPCPDVLKDAAARAIRDDVNQYAITWGAARLRNALAAKYQDWYGLPVDPMTQVTVTCGATEAMAASLLGIVNPGDEVVIFEPFYENYGPDAILCDAKPVFVLCRPRTDRSGPAGQGLQRTDARRHRLHTEQSDRPGPVARRAIGDRRAVPAP